MTTQLDFQKRAELLSATREALSALLHTLQAEVDTIKQGRMPAMDAPTRTQIDAACGSARRAALHCRENLGYPARILHTLQARYAGWGPVWAEAAP